MTPDERQRDDRTMTVRTLMTRLSEIDVLNFVVTNYLPRKSVTRLFGCVSRIEQPLVRDASMALWRLFSDLDLSDAKAQHYKSLHDCFVRELMPGARPVDQRPDIVVSPCDAIVGASGRIEQGQMLQVKGSRYALADLVRDPRIEQCYDDGWFVTLRLTSAMYHRFHAPHDATVVHVSHIAGDALNVNPPTLKRVERVFCRNERAVIELDVAHGAHRVVLIPVAAILVASLRLHFLNLPSDRDHSEPWSRRCSVALAKGEEMGWFEHGSTIIVLAPRELTLCEGLREGARIKMGEPLMALPSAPPAHTV